MIIQSTQNFARELSPAARPLPNVLKSPTGLLHSSVFRRLEDLGHELKMHNHEVLEEEDASLQLIRALAFRFREEVGGRARASLRQLKLEMPSRTSET